MKKIITAGEDISKYSRDIVGGKGKYLLDLYSMGEDTGLFNVPRFFIVSTNLNDFEDSEICSAFERLAKPVAIRSSSPLEDGFNASFAGMFSSFLDQNSYSDLRTSSTAIYESINQERVQNYADRMGIKLTDRMAIIIQEQVRDYWEKGVIQLEHDKAIMEIVDRNGRSSEHETDYQFLEEDMFPQGITKIPMYAEPHDFISEGEFHYATMAALVAKKQLGLEGVVQVEFLLSPTKVPDFVQIRQLPKRDLSGYKLEMDIPDDAIRIESNVCNGIAGELTLPAYVTTSQSGLKTILIQTGQSDLMMLGSRDERADIFNTNSKLASNWDFRQFRDLVGIEMMSGLDTVMPHYDEAWKAGNRLFDDYVLVCDKLDETIASMADRTTNKRGIITCLEAKKTSHAMTVARDLGIPAMGVEQHINDPTNFLNQIEVGDIITMKSDGKRAIAYLKKRRDNDPYVS